MQPSHRSAGLHQYVCFHCVSIRYNLHIGIARHCARTVEHAATRAGGGALPRAIADVGGLFLQFGARLLGVPSSCPDGRTPPPGRAAVRLQRRVLMSGDHFFMMLPKRPTVHDASKTGDWARDLAGVIPCEPNPGEAPSAIRSAVLPTVVRGASPRPISRS